MVAKMYSTTDEKYPWVGEDRYFEELKSKLGYKTAGVELLFRKEEWEKIRTKLLSKEINVESEVDQYYITLWRKQQA